MPHDDAHEEEVDSEGVGDDEGSVAEPAGGSAEEQASGQDEADADGERTEGAHASPLGHGVTKRRTAVASVVGLALLGAVVSPVGQAVYEATGDVLDGGRDFLRGFEGERIDNLKEYVEERDHWVREPQVFDDSFTFLAEHRDGEVASVSGNKLDVAIVSDLINDAPKYTGIPVFLVAQVVERRSVLAEEDGEPEDEMLVTGAGKPDFAYVGAGGYTFSDAEGAEAGDVIVARGLLVASGLAKHEGSRPFHTAYFASQEVTVLGPLAGPISQEIRARARTFKRR